MREAGFDFPDPQFDSGPGGGGMVMAGGPLDSSINPSDPSVRAAMEQCQKAAGMPKPSQTKGGEVVGGTGGGGFAVTGGGRK